MSKIYPQIEIENNVFEVEIGISAIELDAKIIGSEIGYKNGEMPSYFIEMIEEIFFEIPNKCLIKAGYTIQDIKYSKGNKNQLELGNQVFFTDKIITSQLKKSDKAVLFLCSIGSDMEKWSKDLHFKGEPVKSYLINNIASIIVEDVANLLYDHISFLMKEISINSTNRYSPGYCNWSVEEQSKLFSFFPNDFCGVTLSDSNLMAPIKSISGIIGIGENVEYKEYLCDNCGIKDCTHRIYLSNKQKVNTKF